MARAFLNRRSSRIYDRSLLRKKWFPAGGIGVGGLHPRSRKDRKDQDRHTKKKKILAASIVITQLAQAFCKFEEYRAHLPRQNQFFKVLHWWMMIRKRKTLLLYRGYVMLCRCIVYRWNIFEYDVGHIDPYCSKLFVNLNARPALTQWSTLCETSQCCYCPGYFPSHYSNRSSDLLLLVNSPVS